MSIYKLYAAGSGGSEDGIASLDIQADGTIQAINIDARADFDADLEYCAVELSFLGTNTITISDSRGSLLIAQGQLNLTTSGGNLGRISNTVSGLTIPVFQGERVYMHVVATAGVNSQVQGYLYVQDQIQAAIRRRR